MDFTQLVADNPVPSVFALLFALGSPYITAIFTKVTMSSETKNLIASGAALIVALAYVFFTGGFSDPANLAISLGIVYSLQQFSYNQFMKKSVTSVEANVGLKEIKLDHPDEKKEVVEATTVDGSEVVVAVPESEAKSLKMEHGNESDGPIDGVTPKG